MARTYAARVGTLLGRPGISPRVTGRRWAEWKPLGLRQLRSPRSAVAQFALSGLAMVALLGAIGVEVLRHTSMTETLKDAKLSTRLAGEGVAQPNLTPAVLAGRPAALARFDRIIRASVLKPPIVRVKIWTASGHVVYSDEPSLIGARYALPSEERRVFTEGGVEADVSEASRPENRFERGFGKLVEVYLPIRGPGGSKLMFETYQRQASVSAGSRRLWLVFAPALIGALLLLQVFQLPLARSLARRIRHANTEREALLRHAVEAARTERRKIASLLHDGVVQDVATVSYLLAAAAAREPAAVPPQLARDASAELRRNVKDLRSLLVDLYPGGLHGADLSTALSDLLTQLERNGIEGTLESGRLQILSPDRQELVYQAAREGVRNVIRHSGAAHATIRLRSEGDWAVLEVEDDGQGPATSAPDGPTAGHFGLALLGDALADSGGRLQFLARGRGCGALLRAEVPLP